MSGIVPLAEWYPALHERWLREGRRYNVGTASRVGYTIHHTAGGSGEPALVYAQFVASWHFSKWARPGGYNFFIGAGGELLEMCGWDHVGAHAPTCNRRRIGVAFQGVFDHMLPNPRQLAAFARLVTDGPVPDDQVGHRDCSTTGCPGARLHAALPLRTDGKDDDMTDGERKMLQEIHRQLTGGVGGSQTVREKTYTAVDALGELLPQMAGLPADVATEVAKQLPAGTVDVDVLAGKVADVIFERAGKA